MKHDKIIVAVWKISTGMVEPETMALSSKDFV